MLLIIFWLLAAVMMTIAFSFIIPALLRTPTKSTSTAQRTKTNVAIYKERLAELDQEKPLLDSQTYAQAKQELDKNLVQELEPAQQPAPPPTEEANAPLPATETNVSPQPQTSSQNPMLAWVIVLIILVLPIAAVGGYLISAQPEVFQWMTQQDNANAITNRVLPPANAASDNSAAVPDNFDNMITQLAQRLEQNPDDLEGWTMLGRSYRIVGQYAEAAAAYERAIAIAGNGDPDLLTGLAEAKALASEQGHLTGESNALIQAALALDPNHSQALWLAGIAAFQAEADAEAIGYWERFLAQLTDDSSEEAIKARGIVTEYIQQAQQRIAETAATPETTPDTTTPVALTVEVGLAEPLLTRAEATDTVFIYALAINGPPMPLAVARHTVAELPITVTLDDAMAMIETHKLSDFSDIQIGARVSKSGQVSAQAGDLQGMSDVITLPYAAPVNVVISEVVP